VALAKRHDAGIRVEKLRGIRKSRQSKPAKSDAGHNRDHWPFYQLETFIKYKAAWDSTLVEEIPAPYTSQTCHRCGRLNKRDRHAYYCESCERKAHADANASQNIRDYVGLQCPIVLKAQPGGPDDLALNMVSSHDPMEMEGENMNLLHEDIGKCRSPISLNA